MNINELPWGEHIEEIIEDKWDFHDIDYSLYDESEHESLKSIIEMLQEILERPYIIDDFEDHGKRREWRSEMIEIYGKEFDDFYSNNSLKYGPWSSITRPEEGNILSRTFTKKYIGKKIVDLKNKIGDIKNSNVSSDEYNNKPIGEKIEYIKSLKEKVYGLLELVSVKDKPTEVIEK